MKQIIYLLCMFLLFGCSTTKNTEPQETVIATFSTIETVEPTIEKVDNIDGEIPMSLIGALGIEKQFNDLFMYAPSTIDIFIGEDRNEIGFIYEYGPVKKEGFIELKVSDEEINLLKQDKYGNHYTYYGTLTKLADNVYSSKGSYAGTWSGYERFVSDDVDFYIIRDKKNNEKFYFCFENLSLNDLEIYKSEYFAKFSEMIK